MDEGRWVVDGGFPRWRRDGYADRSMAQLAGEGGEAYAVARRAMCRLIERDAARPEPLPTMTGAEIARALHAGQEVEIHLTPYSPCWGDPPYWQAAADPDHWMDKCRSVSIVARIVEPPKPATRTVRADELRIGMTTAWAIDSAPIMRLEHFASPFLGVRWQSESMGPSEWSDNHRAEVLIPVLVPSEEQEDRTQRVRPHDAAHSFYLSEYLR